MEPHTTCGCHADYHELGVHRPDYEYAAPPPSMEADDLSVRGAA